MSNRKVSDGVYLLEGRASYPHLFVERVFDGNPSGYGMTLLLDKQKDKEAIALVAEGIKDVLRESFEGKKLHAERLCMRDGDLAAKDGYEGCMFVSANSKGRPYVLAPDGVTLVTDPVKEPVIYGGCRVTAKISLWPQNHNLGGKRVNAQLVAVQFLEHGVAFGNRIRSPEKAAEGFEPVEGVDPFEHVGDTASGADAGADDNLDDLFDGSAEDSMLDEEDIAF